MLREIIGWRFVNQTCTANGASISPQRLFNMLLVVEYVDQLHGAVACRTSRRQMMDVRRQSNLQKEALPVFNGVMS